MSRPTPAGPPAGDRVFTIDAGATYGDTFDWSLCRTFLAIARRGSIVGAQGDLGASHPKLRRQLHRLEATIGAPLFSRSQDGLRPTPLARQLLPHAERMEAAALALIGAVARAGFTGSVRIATGSLIATEMLPRVAAGIRSECPDLRLELVVSDEPRDLLRREVDVALAGRRPLQEGVVASRLPDLEWGLFASTGWISTNGMPADVPTLAARGCLVGGARSSRRAAAFLDLPEDAAAFALRTDDDVATMAAVAGGIGVGPLPIAAASKREGLTRVLPDVVATTELWLSFHPDLKAVPQVRIVIEALRTMFSRSPNAYERPADDDGQ